MLSQILLKEHLQGGLPGVRLRSILGQCFDDNSAAIDAYITETFGGRRVVRMDWDPGIEASRPAIIGRALAAASIIDVACYSRLNCHASQRIRSCICGIVSALKSLRYPVSPEAMALYSDLANLWILQRKPVVT